MRAESSSAAAERIERHVVDPELLAAGAAGVLLMGLGRRLLGAALLAVVGGTVAARRMSGRCGVCGRMHEQPDQSAGVGSAGEETEQRAIDEVEEASMESFPASDAPSRSVHRT